MKLYGPSNYQKDLNKCSKQKISKIHEEKNETQCCVSANPVYK